MTFQPPPNQGNQPPPPSGQPGQPGPGQPGPAGQAGQPGQFGPPPGAGYPAPAGGPGNKPAFDPKARLADMEASAQHAWQWQEAYTQLQRQLHDVQVRMHSLKHWLSEAA